MCEQLRSRATVHRIVKLRRYAMVVLGPCIVQMLSGCNLTAERSDLSLDLPAAYFAARGAPRGASPALDWWRGFRSRELTTLVENAQTANFDIAVAVARIRQADAQSRIAGAPLLPAIDLDASAQRSRSSGAVGLGTGSERDLFRAGFAASYEIDFWGRNRAISRAAQHTAIVSRFEKDVVALSTLASVGNGYFLMLAAQDRLRIARRNLESANRVLTLIRQRREAGTASDLDVAQQESVVANQRAAIPPLDQQLRQNIAALAVLVGKAPAFLKVRGGSLYDLAIPRVSPGLPSELLVQRPDIRAAEERLAAADANVYAARTAFLPRISLTGSGGFQSSALRTLFIPEAAVYQVAANLAQPLFDGYLLLGQLDLRRAEQQELLMAYRGTAISAFADVEIALIAIADTAERERLQREVVMSSRRAFQIAESRLREGTVDLITVLNIQQTLFQAEDALALARLARLQAVLSLFQALGGSWLPPPPPSVAPRSQ
jgi:NodT family efflux transporter outer membrane factor (OMF) lipoprotein